MIVPTDFFMWISKRKNYHCKVYINNDDVTSQVVESSFNKPVTIAIGDFTCKLLNPKGIISGKYNPGDTIKFYGDTTAGTTLQFWGRIDYLKDNLSNDGHFLEIEGRHRSYILTETLVNASYTATEVADVLKGIIGTYASGFTYTNVNNTGETITVNWNYKPFWECVKILCNYVGFDCYVDDNNDFHFFQTNSILNSDDAIVEGDNYIKIEDWGVDDFYSKTKVTAMGEDESRIPILYTSTYGSGETREVFIKDSSANTETQVQALAEAKLAEVTNIPPQAKILSFALTNSNPGDNIWVVVPRQKTYGIFKLLQISHKFGQKTSWQTESSIEKEIRGTQQVLMERSRKEIEIQVAPNPNKLNFSYNFTFDDSTNIETNPALNCQTVAGKLQLTPPNTTGYIITSTRAASSNITKIQLSYNGWNLGTSTFEVSVDGGLRYETIQKDVLFTPSYSGSNLKLKITLNSTTAQIESLALLYS